MFDINHILLLLQLLPIEFRTSKTKDYLTAAVKPLTEVWEDFIQFRDDIDYDLKFNGQVIYLEHVLNDQFDPVDRLIEITDAANVDYEFVFTNAESVPLYVYTSGETSPDQVYLRTDNELISQSQFVVNIPNTGIDQNALKALIDKYRLASKSYIINIV